jgi:uncharacterized membrane protein YdjX (TVP38/TMEM64 family)
MGRDTSAADRRLLTPAGWFQLLAACGFAAVLVYWYQQGLLTQQHLKNLLASLSLPWFLLAWLILPLVGFPISIALLAAGMKLGMVASFALLIVGMGIHTVAAWYLAHGMLREKLQHWLQRTRFDLPTIPRKHQVWFTALFVTVPGLPYGVKLYSLALTDLPFVRYLWIVWLFHVLNSIPFVGLGAAAATVSPLWLFVFAVLAIGTIVGTKWLKERYLNLDDDSDETSLPNS